MILHPTLTLPMHEGETPTSYADRLGFHLGRAAHYLALDMGTTFRAIYYGEADALRELTKASRLPEGAFSQTAAISLGSRRWIVAGHEVPASAMSRVRVYACPTCVRDDPYGKSSWQLEAVRACTVHGCLLVPLATPRPGAFQDVAMLVRELRDDLNSVAIVEVPESSLSLAKYIEARLAGFADTGWLAQMPLYAAAKVCEIVGLALCHGVHASWKVTSQLDRHLVAAAGYDFLKEGPKNLVDHLWSLRSAAPASERGLGTIYGRLYLSMADTEDEEFEPYKAVLRDHVVATTPLGSGDVVLHRVVSTRRWHSVASIAKELGVKAGFVSRRVDVLNLWEAGHEAVTGKRHLIDAQKHAEVIGKLGDLLFRSEAEAHLGLHRESSELYFQEYLKPYASGGKDRADDLFLKADLDELLRRMVLDAKSRPAQYGHGHLRISLAAKTCGCDPRVVVRLIYEGRLQHVFLKGGRVAIDAIMVNWSEIRSHLKRRFDVVPTSDLRYELRCSELVARSLVKSGILSCSTIPHPVTGNPTSMIARAEIEAFDRKYVSIHELADRNCKQHTRLAWYLRSKGINPVWDRKVTGIPFFERSIAQPAAIKLNKGPPIMWS